MTIMHFIRYLYSNVLKQLIETLLSVVIDTLLEVCTKRASLSFVFNFLFGFSGIVCSVSSKYSAKLFAMQTIVF